MSLLLDYALRPGGLRPEFPLARRELASLVETLLEVLGLSGADLSLTLMDDPGMALMNAKYLDCAGPTNILSFPEPDPLLPQSLGALFLSVDTLSREAFLYGQDPAEHLARLLSHGILHLAGHDHGPVMDELTDLAVDAACVPTASL